MTEGPAHSVCPQGGTTPRRFGAGRSLGGILALLSAALLATLVFSSACGTWYSGLQSDPQGLSPEYSAALREHTRRGWKSRGFDKLVSATATLRTRDFEEVLRAEQVRLLSAPTSRSAAPVVSEVGGGVDVVLFIEALQPAWERLDRPDPVWRFYLEVDGVSHEPVGIAALNVRDATLTHLFPYVSRFGRAWLLSFPVDEVGSRPVLWMTGAPAQLRLEFAVSPSPRRMVTSEG